MISRRNFLATVAATTGSLSLRGAEPKARTILLCSSWQTVNIGDIAHTPGMLRVLEREWPELQVILWPKGPLDRGVQAMLRKRFPKLRIVRESALRHGEPLGKDPPLADAIKEAELFLHGSGPSLVAKQQVEQWRKATDKPWGTGGVTLNPAADKSLTALLDTAAFVYTRETKSLDELKKLNCKSPVLDFAPDATFAVDLRNEEEATKVLKTHDLEPGKFLCAIPRLRFTPYWEMHPERKQDPAEIKRKTDVNVKFAKEDHGKLCEGITAWVRKTKGRVLLCPEMTYQADVLKPLLFDPLPDDVKKQVVSLGRYWITDEASSLYRQARLMLSGECHSPIIAVAHEVPAMYVRQPTDTWKGQMYPDLGLGEWAPEVEKVTGAEVAERLLAIEANYPAAQQLTKKANELAAKKHTSLVATMKKVLG